MRKEFSLSILLILSLLSSSLGYPYSVDLIQPIFADGLDTELLPPVLVEGRQLALFTRMQPSYIFEDSTNADVSLDLRLFDTLDNSTIQNVTYVVIIGRFDPTAEHGVDILLRDGFYSAGGSLLLDIAKSEGDVIEVDAEKKAPIDAWITDPVSGNIQYKTPVTLGGGLYYVSVLIASIEDPNRFFPPDAAPQFVTGLSIGYAKESNIEYANQTQKVTMVSFYDKIASFKYDQQDNTFSWSMPFNWDSQALAARNILIHHEISIPKSMVQMQNMSNVVGSVNGQRLSGNNIALDPYSSEEYLNIHYILSKQELLLLSTQLDSSIIHDMEFNLRIGPANAGNALSGYMRDTEMTLLTESSGIRASIDWTPDNLEAGRASKMSITFSDALIDSPINTDVNYDLRVLDKDGKGIIARSNLTAKSGSDIQELVFPSNEKYYLEIAVNGLTLYPSHKNEEIPSSLDTTRAGIARGIVTVPEFPPQIAFSIIGVSLGFFIAIGRRFFTRFMTS